MRVRLLLALLLGFGPLSVHADEHQARALMEGRTAPFLIADKSEGLLYFADPRSGELEASPALYGRTPGDAFDEHMLDRIGPMPGVTPAGDFTLKRYYSDHLKMEMLVFMEGSAMVLALHKVYRGKPAERRQDRLTQTSLSRRISNGCINVLPATWEAYLSRLPDGTELVVLPEAK